MSKKKDTFIFKKSWAESISKRSAAVQLEVYNAIVSYASDGIIPQMSEVAEAVFDFIKNDIDKNNAKYDEVCKKRSDAGKRGMESRYKKDISVDNEEDSKECEPQQPVTTYNTQEQDVTNLTNDNKCNKSYQTITNVTEYDNDYDNNYYHIIKKETTSKEVVKKEACLLSSPLSVIEEDLNKDDSVLFDEVEVTTDEVGLIDNSLLIPKKPFTDYAVVKDLFNSICVGLPKVSIMTSKRKEKVRLRLKEMDNDFETLMAFLKKVAACSFLNGDNSRCWKADFDWLFNSQDKWISVMEGKYDNNPASFESGKKSELQKNLEFMDSIGVKQENVIF